MSQNIGNVQFATIPIQGRDISPTSADQNIPATVMQFPFCAPTNFFLPVSGTPVTKTVQVWQANNSGTFTGAHASVYTPGSSASVVIDFLKNGVTICSGGTIALTNASVAMAAYNATLSTLSFIAGDILSISMTVSSSTGMAGVSACINGYEISNPR